MKVNMTPNPLDVVTIHASQGDTEARQWGFELHNNGELIDTSSVTEQLFFKAYKGGTEQILPENTSTPTTSPFKGDIKYPQWLLSDQEFTYRQSPTEEDGLAKITDIKGNTLVWNQLVRDNLTDTSQIQTNGSFAKAVSNNVLTLTVNGTIDQNSFVEPNSYANRIQIPTGHKALVIYNVNPSVSIRTRISYATVATPIKEVQCPANTWTQVANIITSTNNARVMLYLNLGQTLSEGSTVQVRNITVFDLTLMGLDISSPSDFTSLFPLPYYAYNQGTLLSFNGNGIKTVGFNQWDGETESGYIYNGITYASNDYWRTKNYIHVIPNETYCFNVPSTQGQIALYDANKVYVSSVNSMGGSSHLVTIPSGCYFARFYQPVSSDSSTVCVNISSSRNGQYEPYTSSTLSLPISTYFPNGMKSAGTVYDELTSSKAITRIGNITLNGSEAWVKSASYPGNYYVLALLGNVKLPSVNAISNSLLRVSGTAQLSANDLCFMFDGSANSQNVNIKNTSMTTLDQFKAWLQANPVTIYYELATPTETSFTTASLVTENAEIPLSNNDGILIGKCTEQLSAEPGFHDAKIKLADVDGECYSNKIQLHIERSPQ